MTVSKDEAFPETAGPSFETPAPQAPQDEVEFVLFGRLSLVRFTRRLDTRATAFRKALKSFEITPYQCFLLGSRPTFDLPFIRDCINDAVKMRRVDKGNRSSFPRVAAKDALVVLADARFQIL